YALPPGASRDVEHKRLVDQLHRVYPETRAATIVDARHEWHDDCPLFPVGATPTARPYAPRTPDWSWPATWFAPASPWPSWNGRRRPDSWRPTPCWSGGGSGDTRCGRCRTAVA